MNQQSTGTSAGGVGSAVWWAWGISLLAGLLFGFLEGHGTTPALFGRLASSMVLVLAGVLAWRTAMGRDETPRAATYPLLIAIGMAFGALGDLFNAGLFGRGLTTLAAMVAFGVGHLFYISAVVRELGKVSGTAMQKGVPIAFWLLCGLIGWWLIVYPAHVTTAVAALVWPALGYTLLLATTAGVGTALGVLDRRFLPLAAGGVLFLVSDLVLGVEIFRGPFPQDTLAVWIPYGCGQMLIVYSAARYVENDANG